MIPPATPPDPLDGLLREHNPYIEDQGFTQRVLQRLPRRRYPWRKTILLIATGLAGGLAWQWLPPIPATNWQDAQFIAAACALMTVTAAVIWGLLSGLQWED
jgi:hypothetical protein